MGPAYGARKSETLNPYYGPYLTIAGKRELPKALPKPGAETRKLLGPSRKESLRVHGGLLGGSWDLVSKVISRLQLG